MAINYTPVGWDISDYVNPTNMNQMDSGIKAACDGVDKLEKDIANTNSNLEKEHIYRTTLNITTNVAVSNMSPFSYKGMSNALAEGIEILGVFVETPSSGDWVFNTSVNHTTRQIKLFSNGNATITCDVIYRKTNG